MAAPREKVFQALTTIEGLAAWWTTKVDGDAGPDGVIDFTFGGDFNPDTKVTEFDSPAKIGWECVGGVEQWADNRFQFELAAQDGGTHLRFRQEYANELGDDDYGVYNYNWGYYLWRACACFAPPAKASRFRPPQASARE